MNDNNNNKSSNEQFNLNLETNTGDMGTPMTPHGIDGGDDKIPPTRYDQENKTPKKKLGRPFGSKNKSPLRYQSSLAWERGRLRYKLKPNQMVIYDKLVGIEGRKVVLHCSRRFGKSFLLLLIGVEEAIRNPGCQISFICPTQRNLRTYIKPIFDQLLKDCPENARPEYRVIDGCYIFPNGSTIYLFGVEGGNMENLRGQSASLAIVDEAGFVDQLEYVVESILMPQLLTTNGRLILSSSSPLSPGHEFVKYINNAVLNNYYFKFTIDEAGYSKELVEEYAKEVGGRQSTTFRREFLCELVRDGERSLCPEWDDQYIQSAARDELFQFYFKIFSLDSGVRDATVGLHGYYDFKKAKLFIEDEFVLSGSNVRTDLIAECIKAKEEQLGYKDVSRYADNENLILIQDLTLFHELPVLSVQKDSLEAMVNMVRLWVKDGRIIINERCKLLIQTLRNGEWNKTKTEFARTDELFHMDAFASLMYMVRMVNTSLNPVPSTFINGTYLDPHTWHIAERPSQLDEWKNILNINNKQEDDI